MVYARKGFLSPILFTIYIDDLLTELEKNGVGCFWNHHFVGAVCYADDVALLAPSPSALRHMLDTCSHFASSHSLVFNASKTQLIRFARCGAGNQAKFSFLGHELELCKSVTHLGHTLTHDLSDDEDIISIKKDLCRKAMYTFSCCNPLTKTKLLQSFCLSLYGSSLWLSSSSEL